MQHGEPAWPHHSECCQTGYKDCERAAGWVLTPYSVFQAVCIYRCRIGCKTKVCLFVCLFFPSLNGVRAGAARPCDADKRSPCFKNRLRVILHRIWTRCAPVGSLRVMTAPSQPETVQADKYGQSRDSLLLLTSCRRFSSRFVSSWW